MFVVFLLSELFSSSFPVNLDLEILNHDTFFFVFFLIQSKINMSSKTKFFNFSDKKKIISSTEYFLKIIGNITFCARKSLTLYNYALCDMYSSNLIQIITYYFHSLADLLHSSLYLKTFLLYLLKCLASIALPLEGKGYFLFDSTIGISKGNTQL